MEVRHLEPIGLILDADIIKLNEDLGRFDVVATIPLQRGSQSRFDFGFMRVKTVESILVFLLIASAKYDLCPRCIKVCYAAKVESTYTKEALIQLSLDGLTLEKEPSSPCAFWIIGSAHVQYFLRSS